jgi:mRNA-degrading endonuclease toxin of MazEF toxin-antitoxin module
MNRGEVAIADLRPHDPKAKVRPVLVVQNDRDNARMTHTIVVMITGNVGRASEPTQLLIDANHPDWQLSGLHAASVVNCSNVYTIHRRFISRVIGSLSPATMQQINGCLKTAMGL